MARGKKKESAVTSEEKLAQALVPDWEWPYKLPGNWCWIKFGQLAVDMSDGPFGSNLKTEHYTQEKQVRIIQLSNIGEDGWREENTKYTTFEHAKTISRSIVKPGNIVIAKMMPAGRAIICPNAEAQYVLSSDVVKMVPHPQLNVRFLLYQINSHHFQIQVQENTQGITRARTSIKKLKEYAFAIPPLAEQQRIVDRIEYLFAKLDEAKEKAQLVLDSFETRKAAILHKAFTGELTAKWRAEYGVGLDNWQSETLQSVCSMKITDGTHKTPTYCDADIGIPFISAKDVTGETICWDKIKYIVPELHEELYARLAPQLDDILLAKNGTTGVAAIVDVDKVFDLYVTLAVLRPDKRKILPRYLLRIVNSPVCKNQFDEHLTGIGVPNLHLRDIKEVVIQVPSLAEQAAIIQIVDSIMEKEHQAKKAAEAMLEKINLLKKSILARAFRGELGTNDPSEESAVELLKKILEADAPEAPKKQSKSIPKELQEKLKTELERKIIHLYFQRETESLPAESLLSVSSKKFDVLEALHNLEQRELIKKLNNGNYRLLG